MGNLSNIRTGMLTSSEIVEITKEGKAKGSIGKPFYTYCKKKRAERFFKQPISKEVEVLAFSWGKLCEKIVHELLPTEYKFQSDVTYRHPKYYEWLGTPDGLRFKRKRIDAITETKCPLTREGFFNLIEPLYDFDGVNVTKKENIDGNKIIQIIRNNSSEGEKYYWQMVSNACIMGTRFAELIVFMPYFEQLEEIMEYNRSLEEPFWLVERKKPEELPFIYRQSGIDNLNIIRFEVPIEDKMFLEKKVQLAIKEINQEE